MTKLKEKLSSKMMLKSKLLLKNEVLYFALKFLVLILIFLVVFYFTFPYYRIALRWMVGGLFGVAKMKVEYPEHVMLDFMPYVSLSALILATPRKTLKEKLKIILVAAVFFFFIDIVFSILQILASAYSTDLLLVQELLVISLPIIIWWPFGSSIFKIEKGVFTKSGLAVGYSREDVDVHFETDGTTATLIARRDGAVVFGQSDVPSERF